MSRVKTLSESVHLPVPNMKVGRRGFIASFADLRQFLEEFSISTTLRPAGFCILNRARDPLSPREADMSRAPHILLAFALSAAGPVHLATAAPPELGERHADFTLPSIADGQPVSLSESRGKRVLLIQFASW